MATLSSDKTYVTVTKGDTLSSIAKTYRSYTGGLSYQKLGDLNNITNYNLIYIGQKIYLTKSSSSSSSSTSTNKPVITAFGLQSNSERTLFATWTWSKEKKNTDKYLTYWTYYTGDNVAFVGSDSSNSVDSNNYAASRQSTYTIPENATKVKFKVKPIAKTKDSSTSTVYWTANWSEVQTYNVSDLPPSTPDTPTVEIEDKTLTVTLDNIDDLNADSIQFQVVKNNSSTSTKDPVAITKGHVSYSCTVANGAEYKVRARSVRDDQKSDWSDYSDNVLTEPAKPSGITTIKANTETSVYLEWGEVSAAETYDIEYATEKSYFDGSDETTTKTGIKNTHWEVTGLETGEEYFFRIRAVNSAGESDWSNIKSVVLGTAPEAPTTWSSSTRVVIGEPLNLYWVHNSEDGSSQTYAELYVEVVIDTSDDTGDTGSTIGGGAVTSFTTTIKNSMDEDEKDKTSSYAIDTSTYSEGATITWRVRTAGITKEYGDWSTERTIEVYAQPTLDLSVTDVNGDTLDTLTTFPFYVKGLAGPNTQQPISYHLSITSNQIYETVDSLGNTKTVGLDEEVYSKHFDISDVLSVEMSANNIDLENDMSYTITCTVAMDSGLTAVETADFTVSWADAFYEVNAEIGINKETLSAYVRPYCTDAATVYRIVTYSEDAYTETDDTVDDYDVDPVYTETGERVYTGIYSSNTIYYCAVHVDSAGNMVSPSYYLVTKSGNTYTIGTTKLTKSKISSVLSDNDNEVLIGVTSDGTYVMYVVDKKGDLVDGVTLSVYRREFDGTYTELMTGINNKANTYITDPHPALDYARYRIVAKTDNTGAVSYYDTPGVDVGEKSIVIQWDEDWSTFNVLNNDDPVDPPWTGSMLKLPYNVDISDSYSIDSSLVEYVGRKYPVTYYGTQLGSTSTWATEIDKSDKELLYGLRRLAIWTGDVYVREPSGSGYWANMSVSFSQTHRNLTIPVSFKITRVEGGV